jgi:uncharacterized cupredoxin-like copper-binding protein
MPAAPRRLSPSIPSASRASALLVAALTAGCVADGGPEAARRAARADSAAAGYSVRADSIDPSGPALARALLEELRHRLGGAPRGDSTGPVVVAIAPPVRRAPVRPATSDSAAPTHLRIDTAGSARPDSAVDSLPRSTGSTPDSLVRSGEFLAYNPARRTVQLLVVAGYDGGNGSLNFNGAARGARVVTIPRDWDVEILFRQEDEALAHSALVAPASDPMPVDAPPPAFPDAASERTTQGMVAGGSDGFRFTADRAGSFVLQCGVPGHAQGGMWLRVVVDSTAIRPRYR